MSEENGMLDATRVKQVSRRPPSTRQAALGPPTATRRSLAILAILVVAGCGPEKTTTSFTLLQANVGNTLLACQDNYIFKLCEAEVEANIKANVAALNPDVVAFQEILPDNWCDSVDETDPRFVCHPDNTGGDPSQIHRILGDDYQYRCDSRNGYECVAAKSGFTLGDYAVEDPVESDSDETCDSGFTVGEITLSTATLGLSLINGHPQSGFIGACRKKQLEQLFDNHGPATEHLVLLTGDWNLDPFSGRDPSVDTWVANVGEGTRLHYLSGIAEHDPPFPTTENALFTGVLDHVASDVVTGSCQTLGEAPGTTRLDGEDGGAGCDHRAISCSLEAAVELQSI